MLRHGIIWLFLLNTTALAAQQDVALSRQCSAIREVIYQSTHNHFSGLLDKQVRNSSGYQVNGIWKFSNEHYSTTFEWPNAKSSIIEHSTDERDTIFTESWQYIATFETIANPLNAAHFFSEAVAQINNCVLPLTDSITVNLQPVDPTELPPTKPDNMTEVKLFYLPQIPGSLAETSIMIGIERIKQGYRPMLMVEVLEQKRKL